MGSFAVCLSSFLGFDLGFWYSREEQEVSELRDVSRHLFPDEIGRQNKFWRTLFSRVKILLFRLIFSLCSNAAKMILWSIPSPPALAYEGRLRLFCTGGTFTFL